MSFTTGKSMGTEIRTGMYTAMSMVADVLVAPLDNHCGKTEEFETRYTAGGDHNALAEQQSTFSFQLMSSHIQGADAPATSHTSAELCHIVLQTICGGSMKKASPQIHSARGL